jgi:hypothetical protein
MKIGGYNKVTDYAKLGPSLLIASSLVLAIRTARWPAPNTEATNSGRDWEAQTDRSIWIARRILSYLTSRSPELFQQKDVAWWLADDEDTLP